MNRSQILIALLVALLWGIQFVTTKVGLEHLPSLLFLALRNAGVAILLLPFVGGLPRRLWSFVGALSVFYGALSFALIFSGLQLISAGLAVILAQLMVPFTIFFAWPLLNERPTLRVVLGVVTAFAGVGVAISGSGIEGSLAGAGLVTGGAATLGLGNVLVRRMGDVPPLRLLGWMSAMAAPQLALASALLESSQVAAVIDAPLLAWGSLAYAVLAGAIAAFGLWFWLLRQVSIARLTPYALLQTVFGIAAGALILHEPLDAKLVGGAIICVAGVALTQLKVFAQRS